MLEDRGGHSFKVGDWTNGVVMGVKMHSLGGGLGFCWILGAVGCEKCKFGGQR